MTEDEVIYSVAYDEGYIDGMDFARSQIDAAAFGAIRRAAEWARSADKHGGSSNAARAALVRQVIRAAIGSEKT